MKKIAILFLIGVLLFAASCVAVPYYYPDEYYYPAPYLWYWDGYDQYRTSPYPYGYRYPYRPYYRDRQERYEYGGGDHRGRGRD